MKREIKFKAWIKVLEIMLEDVSVYPHGDIGIESDKLSKKLSEKDSRLSIDWDSECIRLIDEDNDLFENVLSIMPGDDWIQIDSNKIDLIQYIGLKDQNSNKIYEGDIYKNPTGLIGVIIFMNSAFMYKYKNKQNKIIYSHIDEGFLKNKTMMGNIYENPELID